MVEIPFFSSINFQLEDCSEYVFQHYLRRADTIEMQEDSAVQMMSLISPLSNSLYFENVLSIVPFFFRFSY